MIDEAFLSTLADQGAGPATTCRPVSAVLARARQLQRRRRAARSAGIATIAVGVLCTGFVVANRQGTDRSERVNSASTTTTDKPSGPPPPYVPCTRDGKRGFIVGEQHPLAPSEVPDELRLLPTWLPNGEPLVSAIGRRSEDPCPDTPHRPADPVLALASTGADGVVDRSIWLEGPLPATQEQEMGDGATWGSGVEHGDTPFRGGTATFVHGGPYAPNLRFDWTDADGWSWELWGSNVDEATLRAVGEALVLDSSPEGDEPVAGLPDGAVPAGLSLNWQTKGTPPLWPSDDRIDWTIQVGQSDHTNGGVECMIEVTRRVGEMPLSQATYYGTSHETVDGHDAIRSTTLVQDPVVSAGNTLTWEISPGVQVRAGCADFSGPGFRPLPLDQVKRFAESIVPVAADDPRLP
jgi:hypothetical protein